MQLQLLLASTSPRRSILLQQIGVQFLCIDNSYIEPAHRDEIPTSYVKRMAVEKAKTAWAPLQTKPQKVSANLDNIPVLAADTIVVLDQRILGKPRDASHAREMLAQLSGQTHHVLSAVAIAHSNGCSVRLSTTAVTMRHMTASELKCYGQREAVLDKAGGYAIQGLGALFIETIHGSYSGVMGLPLFETHQLLQQCGIECL